MGILKTKQAAIFDLGSTLIEYENKSWIEFCKSCIECAYQFMSRSSLHLPGRANFRDSFVQAAMDIDQQSLQTQKEPDLLQFLTSFLEDFRIRRDDYFMLDFLEAYYIPIRNSLTIKPGAIEILDFFKNKGCKIGLISNTIFPSSYHLQDMQSFNIYRYFDYMLFSSNCEYRKPHVSIYNDMLSALDISADLAFFVGDRMEIDIVGANNAGIDSVLYKKEGREYADTSDAKLIINSLYELIDNC